MDFSKIKEWLIPEGKVKKVKSVSVDGKVLWKAGGWVPDVPDADQLSAPTVVLDGRVLKITPTDPNTKTLSILVDGVEVAQIEATNIRFTLVHSWKGVIQDTYSLIVRKGITWREFTYTYGSKFYLSVDEENNYIRGDNIYLSRSINGGENVRPDEVVEEGVTYYIYDKSPGSPGE